MDSRATSASAVRPDQTSHHGPSPGGQFSEMAGYKRGRPDRVSDRVRYPVDLPQGYRTAARGIASRAITSCVEGSSAGVSSGDLYRGVVE